MQIELRSSAPSARYIFFFLTLTIDMKFQQVLQVDTLLPFHHPPPTCPPAPIIEICMRALLTKAGGRND